MSTPQLDKAAFGKDNVVITEKSKMRNDGVLISQVQMKLFVTSEET